MEWNVLKIEINAAKTSASSYISSAKILLEDDNSDKGKSICKFKGIVKVLSTYRKSIPILLEKVKSACCNDATPERQQEALDLYEKECSPNGLRAILEDIIAILAQIKDILPSSRSSCSSPDASVYSQSTHHSTLSFINRAKPSQQLIHQGAGDCVHNQILEEEPFSDLSFGTNASSHGSSQSGTRRGDHILPSTLMISDTKQQFGQDQANGPSQLLIQRKDERVKQSKVEAYANSGRQQQPQDIGGVSSSDEEQREQTPQFNGSRRRNGCDYHVESPTATTTAGIAELAHQLMSARLPELKVPKFYGEPTQWLEFWEAFTSSVDKKPLNNAEKLAYLKGYLGGEAKEAIDGYTSGKFYRDAVETLQKQFGSTTSILRSFKKKLNEIKPPEHSYKSLRSFANFVNCICRQMNTLGFNPNGNDSVEDLIYEKLPPKIQESIIRKRSKKLQFGLDDMMKLLEQELGVLKELDERKKLSCKDETQCFKGEKKPDLQPSHRSPATSRQQEESFPSNQNYPKSCIFCKKEDHESSKCPKFTTIEGRRAELARQKRCTKCLSMNHESKKCTKKGKCYKCNSNDHHNLLCETDVPQQSSRTSAFMSKSVSEKKNTTLMSTRGKVKNPKTGMIQEVVILLDSGSSRSFVTKKLANNLKLPLIKNEILSVESFGGKIKQQASKLLELSVATSEGDKVLQVNSTDRICNEIEVAKLVTTEKNANTTFEEPQVVIGNDYFCDFIIKVKKVNSTTILETIIGDIIVGKPTKQKQVAMHFAISSEKQLEDWQYEAAGFAQEDSDDSVAFEMFEKSKSLVDNRFEVGLPWKPTKKPLPSNLTLAYGRLNSVHKKLKEHPKRLQEYDEKFKEQVEQGIIEEVEGDGEDSEIIHYLPHHAVFNPEKPTTKLRIVFDGSAKTCKDNPSINECLFKGKKLLPDLVGILLRTRMFKYLLTGDIEKAFHQIGIRKQDRNACRFIWLKDITKGFTKDNLIFYRFRRIPFGFICSPFLLAIILLFWFLEFDFKNGKELFDNTYVDNVFVLSNDKAKAIELRSNLCDHFLKASMNLREWLSNDQEIVDSVPSNLRQKAETYTKILGIKWNFQKDEYNFSLEKNEDQYWTRRKMLTWIMGAFDPLGFLLPVTTRFKVFMQKVWENTSSWDKSLSSQLIEEWIRLMNESVIPEFAVKRFIIKDADPTKFELHVFSDASKDSYAATVYLKHGDNCSLLFAKSKVKPQRKKSKPLTIPEMELLGAALGAAAIQYVEQQLQQEIAKKYLWTDSMTVWNWLHNCKDSRFVANRVTKIHESCCEYMFVPTSYNPADIPTRGIDGTTLASCDIWWNGPEWLSQKDDNWPKQPEKPKTVERDLVLIAETNDISVEPILDTTKFSSWTKLLRVTATVLKACKKFKSFLSNSGDCDVEISATDLIEAEAILVHREQQIAAETLSKACEIEINENGFMIFKNRMHKADSICHEPIILPQKAHLTKLYVLHVHRKLYHSGGPHTLAEIRRKYWIIRGRAMVKNTLKKECFACKRYLSKPFKLPQMPMLPSTRVNENKAFAHIGLDYFGPINVKSKDNGKRWTLLITCFVTRAIHLEVVNDLTTTAFIRAFRKYVARRGVPDTVLSDNSKTFILASQVLQNLWKEICSDQICLDFFTNSKIEWKFIAEKAPWQGGLYERLVKSVKIPLKAAIGRKWIDEDEFSTLIVEIENIVNSRPLLYVDDETPHILCPANLIGFQPTWYIPEEDESDTENDPDYQPNNFSPREGLIRLCKKEWQKLKVFWTLWNDQYLNMLREKQQFQHKATRGSINFPQSNEVVLVKDDQYPRSYWKLAKIKELLHSNDGRCRSALIEYSNGRTTRRPLNALYPLEINLFSPRECGESSTSNRHE